MKTWHILKNEPTLCEHEIVVLEDNGKEYVCDIMNTYCHYDKVCPKKYPEDFDYVDYCDYRVLRYKPTGELFW